MFRFVSSTFPESVVKSFTAAYFKVNAWYKVGSKNFHSLKETVTYNNMKINILPALSDNYMYMLIDEKTREAAIVDPVEPKTVLHAVETENVKLTTILTTHHHWDHAGGNAALVSQYPQPLNVIGGDERIEALTRKVSHKDTFTLGELKIECLFTPCHTRGHICYHVTDCSNLNQKSAVFTGDTLFLGGCGKFFEGDAVQMYEALIEILGSLPDDTDVYCGHEYTQNNLSFGIHVEPNNATLQNKIQWARERRNNKVPTVPSTIGEEKLINPFMRVNESSILNHTKTSTGVDAMRILRAEKDSFKPPPAQ